MVRPENPHTGAYTNRQSHWLQKKTWQEGSDAQLRAVVAWIEREDGFRNDPRSIYLGIPKSKWQALKAELENDPPAADQQG